MARKKKPKIPGVSFSWKRASGITNVKRKISRKTGVPFTKAGRQRKIGKMMTGSGCLIYVLAALLTIIVFILF